jgi:carbonic anhydrase
MPVNQAYLELDGAISAEFQQSLTPKDAHDLLKAGHERFMNHLTHRRSRGNLLADAAEGQYPYAAVLGCIDSRVPVEELFDAAFGDLFVARVAGNTANPDILGSLEYACKYAGSKLVLVLGHTQCGAVKGAWAGLEDGNLTGLLNRIAPAVGEVKASHGAEATEAAIDACVHTNVEHVCDQMRKDSAILSEMESQGKIAIVGAVYNVATGVVTFL